MPSYFHRCVFPPFWVRVGIRRGLSFTGKESDPTEGNVPTLRKSYPHAHHIYSDLVQLLWVGRCKIQPTNWLSNPLAGGQKVKGSGPWGASGSSYWVMPGISQPLLQLTPPPTPCARSSTRWALALAVDMAGRFWVGVICSWCCWLRTSVGGRERKPNSTSLLARFAPLQLHQRRSAGGRKISLGTSTCVL